METENIILYDGQCGLCIRSVQSVIRGDREARFRFASLQSSLGRKLSEQHGIDAQKAQSLVLIERDGAYMRGEAVIRIVKHLKGPLRLLAILRFVPRCMRDRLYRFVARYRFAWFGRRETCWLPSRQVLDRFLDTEEYRGR